MDFFKVELNQQKYSSLILEYVAYLAKDRLLIGNSFHLNF